MDNENKLIIGITGEVGSGKSSLLDLIKKKLPVKVIKADELGHEVYKRGSESEKKIEEHFGKGILSENGGIDRKKLGNLVFNNQDALEWLNNFIHPYVRKRIEDEVEKFRKDKYIKALFIESAIILENGYEDICDEFWYVWVSRDNRRKRLEAGRGYSGSKVEDILKNQLPEALFREKCSVVIDNNGPIENTLAIITHFLDLRINYVI